MKRYRIIARFEDNGLLLTTNGLGGYFTSSIHALDMAGWLHTQYPHCEFLVLEDR